MAAVCRSVLVGSVAVLLSACLPNQPEDPEETSSAVIEGSMCWPEGQWINWECCPDHRELCITCDGDPLVCEPDVFCPMQPTPEQITACCFAPGNDWQCVNESGVARTCVCNCDAVDCPAGFHGKSLKGGCKPPCDERACPCRCVDDNGTQLKPDGGDPSGKCVANQ